jgi:exodeoxyribonuclease-3
MSDAFTLVTWNVNSIRARLDNVLTYLDEVDPDVVCLQETKVEDRLFPRVPFMEMGYSVHLNGEGGYAGVAVMTKGEASEVHRGFRHGPADKHPRILSLSVSGVRIYCLYVPNGGGTPDRAAEPFAYKLDWYARLRAELDALHTPDESVLLCGDFNIAPDERDVWSVEAMEGGTHFTPDEHAALSGLLDFGLRDCFRKHRDDGGDFTWFDYRAASWERGHGLRIDHVYATTPLWERNEWVRHDREPRGWDTPSDHLPVVASFAAG